VPISIADRELELVGFLESVQLDTHSNTAEKSNLEIKGDNSFTHIKEEPVDHEFIEFEVVEPREILIKLSPLISKFDFSAVLECLSRSSVFSAIFLIPDFGKKEVKILNQRKTCGL
jgi:hypothetical protein